MGDPRGRRLRIDPSPQRCSVYGARIDFAIPADIQETLDALDAFIAAEIVPLHTQDDNMRFFDHRREHARTDWEHDGVPRRD